MIIMNGAITLIICKDNQSLFSIILIIHLKMFQLKEFQVFK